MSLLETAISLAVEKHRGQVDKSGEPYILHPLRVLMRVRELGGSEAAQCAAVLHDVAEDCNVSLDDLRAAGFTDDTLAAIDAVTKRADEHGDAGYAAFVDRAAADPLARLVKIADLEDNMDPRRLCEISESTLRRMERYRLAWKRLTSSAAP